MVDEVSSNSKWSLLEGDVLESICEHLSFRDYLAVRAVCSNWRAVAKAMHHLPSHKVPLLLYVDIHHRKLSLFNLSKSTRGLFCLKWPTIFLNSNHIFCHGTLQGWMIMTEFDSALCQTSVFFCNPITQSILKLPSILPQINSPMQISKIVASSPHTDPNCVLVCLYSDHCNFAFSRINNSDDSSWTLVKGDKDSGINFMEVEIHKDKLYAVTDGKLNSLLVYDLQQPPSVLKPIILAKLPAGIPSSIICDNMFQHLAIDTSSEELFLVYDNRINLGRITTCQVFKLRMINDSKAGRWTQVDDLGERLLFVGEHKSLVVSQRAFDLHGPERFVSYISPTNDPQKLKTNNCVYFGTSVFWNNVMGHGVALMEIYLSIYCLTDQSVSQRRLLADASSLCNLSQPLSLSPPPIWFTPTV